MVALRAQGVSGEQAADDDGLPYIEPELERLWGVWRELSATRSSGMVPNPISYSEIEAFCRLTGEQLEPWEARAVRAVDDAYMRSLSEPHEDGGTA